MVLYFPYFRGRQYELLALRDLASNRLISTRILPIIEPVKMTTTFLSVLQVFKETALSVGIVMNPSVGELGMGEGTNLDLLELIDSKLIIPSVLIKKNAEGCLDNLREKKGVLDNQLISVLENRDELDTYRVHLNEDSHIYTLIPDARIIKKSVKGDKVLFADRFKRQLKNAEYPEDEFFSDDHLFYRSEGFAGFGDYSIVGNDYNEGGWAPYAVAIHVVYFNDDKELRIKHFISDSNQDISDVAGKFYEAVTKLAQWYEAGGVKQKTKGLETLVNHYYKRTYPGLPSIKKLTIMHHLELMNIYLYSEDKK